MSCVTECNRLTGRRKSADLLQGYKGQPMPSLDYWILLVFFGYFATLIGIAIVRSRQMRGMADYVLGDRRLSSFTSALSAGSSAASGWTMLVFPALVFAQGSVHLWSVPSILFGSWLAWTLLAKRLRRYTIATDDSLTLPEFFEKRFGDRTGILRTVTALITLFFIVFYVGSGLIAGSKLLETVFGLGANTGVLVTLVAVASYTCIGGFLAVSRTDVFQSLLMLISFIILPLTLIAITDHPFRGTGATIPGFFNPFTQADGSAISFANLVNLCGWALGFLGAQRILQRFMAVESEGKIAASRNISLIWVALLISFGFLLGLVARPALLEVGMLEAVSDPERLYIVVSEAFFFPLATGLLLTAVIAAVMSTADSQLLLGSAVAAGDLPFIKNFSNTVRTRSRVWLGRLLLTLIGVFSAGLAIFFPNSIFNLVAYAWGGMGAAFGPVTILALYWRRFNTWGALASIITGTVVTSIWQVVDGGPGGIMDIGFATAPGFLFAMPMAVVVTLLTPVPSQETVALFDRVNPPKGCILHRNIAD